MTSPLTRKPWCAIALLTAAIAPASPASELPLPIFDSSFEEFDGELPNPPTMPPTSGTLGGWSVERGGSVALSGSTIPRVSTAPSGFATDGAQIGSFDFVSSLDTFAEFSQITSNSWMANSHYVLEVDVIDISAVGLLDTVTLALTSDGMVYAVSSLDVLSVLDLGGGASRYTFEVDTGATAPAGSIGIALRSDNVLGLVGAIGFDRVGLTSTPIPEPSTATLVAMGLLMLSSRGRARGSRVKIRARGRSQTHPAARCRRSLATASR